MFRIAHNRSVTALVRRCPEPLDLDETQVPVDSTPGPVEQLDAQRRSTRLLAAVRRLHLGVRQVLTLRLEGFSYSEISEVLGISESSVAVRLSCARERLHAKFGRVG